MSILRHPVQAQVVWGSKEYLYGLPVPTSTDTKVTRIVQLVAAPIRSC